MKPGNINAEAVAIFLNNAVQSGWTLEFTLTQYRMVALNGERGAQMADNSIVLVDGLRKARD